MRRNGDRPGHGTATAPNRVRGVRHMLRAAVLVWTVLATVAASAVVLSAGPAGAAVAIARAQLVGGRLRIEGSGAVPNSVLTVTGVSPQVTGRADAAGAYRIDVGGISSATCRATVSDGSTSATAALVGCTPSAPPPPPPPGPPPPPPPPPPPSNGKFAYTENNLGCCEIATAFPNGTGAKVFTAQFTADPAWSPDGRLLAFDHAQFVFCRCVGDPAGFGQSSNHLQVMSATGTGLRNITNPGAQVTCAACTFPEAAWHDIQPAWSPDGTRLAFTSTRGGSFDIWVVNADGTGLLNLTNSPAAAEEFPSWSSTGKILFSRAASTVALDQGEAQLWAMNPDGTGAAPLPGSGFDYNGDWSPDGSRIVFVSKRDDVDPVGCNVRAGAPCNYEIYAMNADGTGQIRLTNNPGEDLGPSWSPDGRRIVFERTRSGLPGDGLYTMNPDGTGQTTANGDPAFDSLGTPSDPDWQNAVLPPSALVHLAIAANPTAFTSGGDFVPQDNFDVLPQMTSGTGRVDLTGPAPAGGATVTLVSSSPAMTVPASVVVPAGQDVATFPIAFNPVDVRTQVTLTATGQGVTDARTFFVDALATRVTHVRLLPASIVGGNTATVAYDLNGSVPPAGATVVISTSSPHVHAPATQTLTWGNGGGSFDVTTDAVPAAELGTVTVSLNANASSAAVSLVPVGGPVLSSFVLPATVNSGSPATGTVTLSGPAPAGGALVLLNTAQLGPITTPPSVTVAAGTTSASFAFTTTAVTASTVVTLDASYGSVISFARVTLAPPGTVPPTPVDTVTITRLRYDAASRTLRVEATSTNAAATLRVFQTSPELLIGTLTNNGAGRFSGQFSGIPNPVSVTVRSSAGGSATQTVP